MKLMDLLMKRLYSEHECCKMLLLKAVLKPPLLPSSAKINSWLCKLAGGEMAPRSVCLGFSFFIGFLLSFGFL